MWVRDGIVLPRFVWLNPSMIRLRICGVSVVFYTSWSMLLLKQMMKLRKTRIKSLDTFYFQANTASHFLKTLKTNQEESMTKCSILHNKLTSLRMRTYHSFLLRRLKATSKIYKNKILDRHRKNINTLLLVYSITWLKMKTSNKVSEIF